MLHIVLYALVYPFIYVSMLPSVLQSFTFIGHGVAGASCPRCVLLVLSCISLFFLFFGGAMFLFLFYLVYVRRNYRKRIDKSICYGI